MNDTLMADLKSVFGEANVSAAQSVLQQHSHDQSSHRAFRPDAVVWPEDVQQVSAVAAYAHQRSIPLVGWGAGSSLEGNPIPVRGGIVVDFQRMNQIVTVHAEDFQVTVQPGILYKDMNRQLARYGLFFAPDPGANASIGGMIANNAGGTRTVKYGATRDNVLALEVVLANGEIIRTGSRSVKQSAGFDLTHLFIGSEGTLGLVTQATLRLSPIPERFSAALAAFSSVEEAANAVYGIMGSGIVPAAIELLDSNSIGYIQAAGHFDLPPMPHLLLELHGASEVALNEELALVQMICEECGTQSFTAGVGRDERNRLWEGRHNLLESMLRMHPGETYLITDVAVPISALPKIVAFANQLMQEKGLKGALFGHAGDGNLHTICFSPFDSEGTIRSLNEFNQQVTTKAIALNGTCTGEHGVGIGKRKYLIPEYGAPAVALMGQLKQLLDPAGILNPGKIVGGDAGS